jgi:hypothetical protein
MSEKIIIALIVMLGLNICAVNLKTSEFKYQIVKEDYNVYLLDKQNGYVWRNTYNNNKDRIPSNWDYMTYSGSVVPDGEQKRRDLEFKAIPEKPKKENTAGRKRVKTHRTNEF